MTTYIDRCPRCSKKLVADVATRADGEELTRLDCWHCDFSTLIDGSGDGVVGVMTDYDDDGRSLAIDLINAGVRAVALRDLAACIARADDPGFDDAINRFHIAVKDAADCIPGAADARDAIRHELEDRLGGAA